VGNVCPSYGGAIWAGFDETDVTLSGCTLVANFATNGGGGLHLDYQTTTAHITDTIFWENSDSDSFAFAAQISTRFTNTVLSLRYSIVQNLAEAYAGNGNLALDPRLVDPRGGDDQYGTRDDDLHLREDSPARNAGDWLTFGGAQDIDGQWRVMAGRVDIGADEFAGRPFVFGDLNCDWRRDNFDIDPFAFAISDPAGYDIRYSQCDVLNADINGDGAANNFDIDAFVALLAGA
jgi:hypothetical protein